ncbi:FAR1 DNA-binding domain [Sesbania bispinosa]|nr:FAR1 DNA-binding domain [Sesbania bispinosa]
MAEEEYLTFDKNNGDKFGKKNIDEMHATIPIEFIPKVGMEFDIEEAAYTFYNSYAYKVGFSIRNSKGHKDGSGKIVDKVFCCSCEGYRGKDKREANTKNPRAQTRFGCLAKMKYEEEEEFLVAWNNMLEKYDLQDNSWLKQTFALKEKWALVYGRANFCADMTTIQRIHEDPKERRAERYQDLCRRKVELETKGRGGEVDAQGVSSINTENAFTSGNNKSVKGLKTKERFCGTSTRPKGVLERRRKKKKVVEPDEPSSQNLDCELPSFQSSQLPTNVACNISEGPTSNMSMMELLQAQLSGFEHGHQGNDGSNSQSQDQ